MDVQIEGLQDLRFIGQGGFGTVYRAWQADFGRDVAVKVLPASRIDDRSLARFERERQALGRLSGHPHIIAVHDHGTLEDSSPYLVMEYAAGGSLGDRVAEQGEMPWPAVVSYAVPICSALTSAHDAGVLHRDVKPDNILLTGTGVPKLADFGIARLADRSPTDTGSVTASLLHAAPELLDGADPSIASDLYALGSTLFTLAAGHAPFEGHADTTMPALLRRIALQPPPDLRPLGVPDAIAEVIEQLLAKDPAARPGSAGDVAHMLQEAAAGGPQVRHPGTDAATAPLPHPSGSAVQRPRPVSGPRAGRRRTALLLTVIAFAGVLGGLALAGVLGQDSDDLTSADAAEAGVDADAGTDAAPAAGPPRPVVPTGVSASSHADVGVDAGGVETTYVGANVSDGDVTTAWRTPGDGVGERLTFTFDAAVHLTELHAVTGYDKADPADGRDRWQENRRVLQLSLIAEDGETVVVDLADTRGRQTVPIPDLGPTSQVIVEVRRTTGHGGRDFTAISELGFVGR